MRLLILTAGIALSLSACGKHDQREAATNADEGMTAENIVTNDVTAIDAVTADAANMAADVNYMMPVDNGPDNALNPTNDSANAAAPASRKARPKSPSASAPGRDTPSGNAVANTSANGAE